MSFTNKLQNSFNFSIEYGKSVENYFKKLGWVILPARMALFRSTLKILSSKIEPYSRKEKTNETINTKL